MPVVARNDEPGSRLRPFRGVRPPRRGQWTAGARRSPTVSVTAVKESNDRMRGSQFSSCNISFPYPRYGRAPRFSASLLAEWFQVLSYEIVCTLHRVLGSRQTPVISEP